MTASTARIYLPALAQRWQQSPEHLVEMALQDRLRLWLCFNNVLIHRPQPKKGKRRPVHPPEPTPVQSIDLQLTTQALAQLHGRCDRMLVVAELPCLDADGAAVTVSNSLGEEWGEVSMMGLKPQEFFALLDEVQRIEAANGLGPDKELAPAAGGVLAETKQPLSTAECTTTWATANHPDHPGFAPELEAALHCWQALYAHVASETIPDKAAILTWLQTHKPELSKTAMDRIAFIVSPRPSRSPAAKRRKEKES